MELISVIRGMKNFFHGEWFNQHVVYLGQKEPKLLFWNNLNTLGQMDKEDNGASEQHCDFRQFKKKTPLFWKDLNSVFVRFPCAFSRGRGYAGTRRGRPLARYSRALPGLCGLSPPRAPGP